MESTSLAVVIRVIDRVKNVRGGSAASTRFIVFGTEWFLLAVADGSHAVGADSELYKLAANRIRPVRSQRHVVFFRTALIAMSGDDNLPVRVGLQELRVRLQHRSVGRPQVVLVIVKENVLNIPLEQFLFRRSGEPLSPLQARLASSPSHGHRLGGASRAFRCQRVGRRVRRGHAPGSLGSNSSQRVDGYVGGILCAPR